MTVTKATSLFFREGASDKVYNATINEVEGGYTVNFSYGRRGNTLTQGTKTPNPVTEANALTIFSRLIVEKTAKGYKEDGNAITLGITPVDIRDTGIRPQLLNDINEAHLEKYLTDDDWCAQEKFDGRRRLLLKTKEGTLATNRKGLTIAASNAIMDKFNVAFEESQDVITLDGEDMGNTIKLFDAISVSGNYKERYAQLFKNCIGLQPELEVVYTAWTTDEKRVLFQELTGCNAEGIVFKRWAAEYKPGRPNSGGDQMKYKFCATASCLVTKINTTKRSVMLSVYDGNELVPVGNTTIYPNQEVPLIGSVVEIKYLYYFKGGSLFQPVYLGERDDLSTNECTIEKLKLKPQTDPED